MIMCVLLCYPVSIHMSQLLSTGRPISSFNIKPMDLISQGISVKMEKSGTFTIEIQSQPFKKAYTQQRFI